MTGLQPLEPPGTHQLSQDMGSRVKPRAFGFEAGVHAFAIGSVRDPVPSGAHASAAAQAATLHRSDRLFSCAPPTDPLKSTP